MEELEGEGGHNDALACFSIGSVIGIASNYMHSDVLLTHMYHDNTTATPE